MQHKAFRTRGKGKKRKVYPITPKRGRTTTHFSIKAKASKHIKGMKRDKGLIDLYRRMHPTVIKESRGLTKGDLVKYKKSSRVVERAWGKQAGVIEEIRVGRSGPLVISATSMANVGPKRAIALISASDGTIHFSDTRDLIRVNR